MSVAYLSDCHFTDRVVACREDDVFDTQIKRFRGALELCTKHKVSKLYQAGDFFDRPRASNRVLCTLIRLLQEFNHIRVIVLPGQHDLQSHEYETWEDSSDLAILQAAGVIDVRYLIRGLNPADKVNMIGFGHPNLQKLVTGEEGYFDKVVVAHATIGEGASPYWTAVEDCKFPSDVGLVVLGDVHAGIPLQRVGKTIVWNGGVLTPMKSDEPDKPELLIHDDAEHKLTVHPLKDYGKVVLRAVVDTTKDEDQLSQDFLDSIDDARTRAHIDPKSTLDEVMVAKGVPDAVKALSHRILHEVMTVE